MSAALQQSMSIILLMLHSPSPKRRGIPANVPPASTSKRTRDAIRFFMSVGTLLKTTNNSQAFNFAPICCSPEQYPRNHYRKGHAQRFASLFCSSFPDSAQILAATRIISLSKANFNLFMLLRDSNSAFSAYSALIRTTPTLTTSSASKPCLNLECFFAFIWFKSPLKSLLPLFPRNQGHSAYRCYLPFEVVVMVSPASFLQLLSCSRACRACFACPFCRDEFGRTVSRTQDWFRTCEPISTASNRK